MNMIMIDCVYMCIHVYACARICMCIYIYIYVCKNITVHIYHLIQNEEQRGSGLKSRGAVPLRTSGSMADVLVLIVSIDKKAITASDF